MTIVVHRPHRPGATCDCRDRAGRTVAIAAAALAASAIAQASPVSAEMPPPEGQMAVVGYVDVARRQVSGAQSILETLVAQARQDPANTQALLLQNSERPTEYVELSTWRTANGYTRFADQPAVRQAQAKLVPMQTGPFDERQGAPLDGPVQMLLSERRAVYVVTHVDIVPQKIGDGLGALKRFQSASAQQRGCLEIEILRQASRPNHFTILEVWDSPDAFESHLQSAEMRGFRQALLTMSGSLYDQRPFHLVATGAARGAQR